MCDASRNASCRPREQTEPVMPWVNSTRCVIVDDNPHFIESAVNLLECDGITVVSSATSSAEALQLVDELCPDVTLVDVDLGTESGFELAKQIHRRDGSRARQPPGRPDLGPLRAGLRRHSGRESGDRLCSQGMLSARLIRQMLGQA